MREARQLIITIALAMAAAILCSGCLAMMIPGVAYSGYKYEHDKNQTASSATSNSQSSKSTTATNASTHSSKSASAQPQKIPDSEIE